jgi:hypothetical protein
MARARRLIAAAALAAAHVAWAGPCEEARERTGLALAVRDAALVVATVDDGSAAAASGVRPGDVVLQVNGVVPRTCAEWEHAVDDARRGGKALLLFVRRAEGELPLALAARAWGVEQAEAAPPSPPGAPAPPPRPRVPEPPAPLPDEETVSVDSTLAELGALLAQARAGLPRYRDAVTHARRAVETLQVRKAAPADAVDSLRGVARLHEAAAVAWDAMERIRERDRIPTHLPISDGLTASFYAGSAEQSALDEFDFLRETIAVEPRPGRFTETSGEWRPAAARRLLWEHAGEALGRAAASLVVAP